MAVMVGPVGALSAFYHDSTDICDPVQRDFASIRMVAKLPTLAAMAYKYSIGQPFVYPKNELDYASNFLRMCYAVPCEEYHPNPVLARAMDRIFILHADHEQGASTSTVRLSGSSGANPFACIAAGCACLWGPAHGPRKRPLRSLLPRPVQRFVICRFSKNPRSGAPGWRLTAAARPQNEVRAFYYVSTTTLGLFLQSSAAVPAARRSPKYGPACREAKQLGHTIQKLTLGDVLQRQDLNKHSELT
jgi:hypothetical protein